MVTGARVGRTETATTVTVSPAPRAPGCGVCGGGSVSLGALCARRADSATVLARKGQDCFRGLCASRRVYHKARLTEEERESEAPPARAASICACASARPCRSALSRGGLVTPEALGPSPPGPTREGNAASCRALQCFYTVPASCPQLHTTSKNPSCSRSSFQWLYI